MVTLGSWVFCSANSANSVIFMMNYLYQSPIIIVIKSMNHNMKENGKGMASGNPITQRGEGFSVTGVPEAFPCG